MDDKPRHRPLDILNSIPLLLIPVLIYNIVVLFSPAATSLGESVPVARMRGDAFVLPMFSGASLSLTWGDMLLLLTIVFLLVDVVRSTRRGSASILTSILTMALFVLCLIQFLALPAYASSSYFLLTMIVLLQSLTGLSLWRASSRQKAPAVSRD